MANWSGRLEIRRIMHYVLFLLCSLVWSGSFILMKKAALGFTPLSIAAWRCVWGAVVVGFLCWQQGQLRLPRRDMWGPLGVVILLGCACPYVVQPWVVARQGSSFMALVVSFVPLATVLASLPLLRQWPTSREAAGVCGALLCLVLLLADGVQRHIAATDLALAVSVPCGYAVANTMIRGWLRDLSSLTLTFYVLTATAGILVPLSQLQTPPRASPGDWWWAWTALASLGVVGTGLATYWFNWLIRERGALFAGMATNLVPLGAVLWGWADNEHVSWRQCLAVAGIVSLVAWVQFGSAGRRPPAWPEDRPVRR